MWSTCPAWEMGGSGNPMKRRLFNLAGAVSLIGFFVMIAAVFYSYTRGLHMQYHSEVRHLPGLEVLDHNVHLFNGGMMIRSWHGLHQRFLEMLHPSHNGVWRWDRGFRPERAGYPRLDRGSRFLGFALYFQPRESCRPAPTTSPLRMTEPKPLGVELVMPLWFPLLLTSVLPVSWVLRHRQARRRVRLALCATCGYDLRATPEKSGEILNRCPECGMPAKPQPAAEEAAA